MIRGLDVIAKSGLTISINLADCLVFNPSDQNGAFYAGLADDPVYQLTLPADQPLVYVEARFGNDTGSPVNAAFWDPLALTGDSAAGAEFTSTTDFESKITIQITANTVGFSDGAVPLLVATTAASSITTMEDRRELMFRLGRGGSSPNPLYKYPFASTRQEPVSSGSGVGNATDSPWRSTDSTGSLNDKAFKSFKDWADAVMTKISEIAGSPIWYLSSSSVAPVSNISLNQVFFDTLGHSIQPSSNAAFKWKTVSGSLRLTSEGTLAGSAPYAEGLIRWKSNYTNLEWHLGGTFVSSLDHNYTDLRFTSPAPADGGNVYLKLEREVPKGSGASVDWLNNTSYTGFAASKAVSGNVGDFTGIALGDYIRKESEGYSRYYKVVKFSDGTPLGTYTIISDPNKVADSSIIALELENISDPSLGIQGGASSEPLRYFRARYSDADVFADTTPGVYQYQNADYYWLGRRQGSLFFLRDYGTMQEGEEVTTIDATWAKGRQGGGNDLILKHANQAEYDSLNGYRLKTGSGTLLTLRRYKRNNTFDTPSSGDNSGALLEYTLASPVGTMADGETLWVRLSDTTGGALSNGAVTNSTDDLDNTDVNTNRWQVRPATTTPPRTFDDKDVYLIARKFTLSGTPYLIFFDGSMLTEDGQWIDNNFVIQSDLFLRNKTLNSVLFIGTDGKVEEDNAQLFYDPLLNSGTFAAVNFRMYYDSANNRDHFEQAVQRDAWMLSGTNAKQVRLGGLNTDVYVPGNLFVDGTTTSVNTSNLTVEDKLITLGAGLLVDTAQGAGIEIADRTLQATQIDSTNGSPQVLLTYGAAHGYALGQHIGFDTNVAVGGIQAGQITREYVIVATATLPGEAQVISPTTLRIIASASATSTATVVYSNPTTYGQSFDKPWSIRLSDAASNYTGRTSYSFRVKGVATAPSLTPVASYGIVPTAHSANMLATRIPFVNDDNAGPGGVDSTLNFSSSLTWNNTTSTLVSYNVQVNHYEDFAWINDPAHPSSSFTRLYASLNNSLLYQRTQDGNISLVSNPQGNVYEEIVDVVSSPVGNNQMAPIAVPPTIVTLPKDRKKYIGQGLIATTDGSTATVTVSKLDHGLDPTDTVTVTSIVPIGGISALNLSVTNAAITVIDANTFSYTALASSTSVDSGYLERVTAVSRRRYIVGDAELEIYRNGQMLTRGAHYNEVGSLGTNSFSVQILIPIILGDSLTYRIDSNGGLLVKVTSGGTAATLQDAYDGGNSIITVPGFPVSITAPTGFGLEVIGDFDIDGRMRWDNDTSLAAIPTANKLVTFVQNNILYQRTEDGNVQGLTNVIGSIYEENVDVVSSPSGNNQMAPLTAPATVTIPRDTQMHLGSFLKAQTDGTTAIVTVSKLAHGLVTGDTVTVITSTSIGGISAVNLSVTNVTITVIGPDSFAYTALAVSSSAATGSLDSVYVNTARPYRVGSKELEIYLNGQALQRGYDYNEVGTFGSSSTSVQFLLDIELTDVVTYRIDANGGRYFVNTTGGSGDLQDAYDLGNTINVVGGVPVNLLGTGTLLYVQDDLQVDGLII